ncbi:MAG: hypothetical protein AVW06_01295 [Hadesarchaea archaeon DG-33-1]|nr:MAG: hypothetical protein AVW06_01295 [Hadesarchaea archaeon DG-33-1]
MIKAIAIDIDGTMTYKDRRLDVAALDAVRRAEVAGLSVVLATGNVFCFAEAAAILLGASGPLIAEDGGIVFDRVNGREHVLGYRVETERGLAALKKVFSDLRQTRSSRMRLTGLTIERTITAEQAMEVFRMEALDLVAIDSGFAIHVKSPSVNKGDALRKAASLLGISTAEIAAIGDAPNDVEMLRVAGLSFAVANSHELAKKAATQVTKKSHGEGVAEAVEKIIELYR